MTDAADVAIVGGGPVGTALALALAGTDVQAVLLESRARTAPVSDGRPLALSYGSRLILERLGAWQTPDPGTAIQRIHVSQRGGFGHVEMSAAEAGLPALGYVVEYDRVHSVLAAALANAGVPAVYGAQVTAIRGEGAAAELDYRDARGECTLAARVVIVADGGTVADTAMSITDYRQSAVVGVVKSEVPHRGTAFERFTPQGPLALLPRGDDLALVWSMDTAAARQRSEEPAERFLGHLGEAFGARLGRFTAVGARSSFPLSLRIGRAAGPRTAYIGNAAQTLHPVAGQGFNLGLRDAWELAEEIRHAEREMLGAPAMLEAWRRRRQFDRRGGTLFTDALVRVFSNDYPPLRVARGLALAALDALPPAKDLLVRRMIFGARG